MAIVDAKGLSKFYAGRRLFAGVTFSVGRRETVGMVGRNGTGKTTILRIIAGAEHADDGQVSVHASSAPGWLRQVSYDKEARRLSLWETALAAFGEIIELRGRLRQLEASMAAAKDGAATERLLRRYGRLTEEYEHRDGYSCEYRTKKVLGGLGFADHDFARPVATLSGGESIRLQLARLLLEEPPLLLLDEPSNHLDWRSVLWLEGHLAEYPGAVLTASHDRYFLNRIADRILELDGGAVYSYKGNYDQYKRQKRERLERQRKQYDNQQGEIARHEAFIARFGSGTRASQAQDRQKKLARMERVEEPQNEGRRAGVELSAGEQRAGREVVELEDLGHRYGDGEWLFRHLDLTIAREDRVGLFGPNGAGKSTFLKILLGEVEPAEGVYAWDRFADVGYLAQDLTSLAPDETLVDLLMARGSATVQEARDTLGRYLFHGDDHFKEVCQLSGGERTRLVFALLLVAAPNVLVLDEPTNHLDVESREVLEEALLAYTGTVIFVTHDRYFLNRVANRLLVFAPGESLLPRLFEGSYHAFEEGLGM